MRMNWAPEGPGYYAQPDGVVTFCVSSTRPPVSLSWHNGDGQWKSLGRYATVQEAVSAANAIAELVKS